MATTKATTTTKPKKTTSLGKVPFAEQLANRCKPYFDGLLNSGIDKFDEYIKTLNAQPTEADKEMSERIKAIQDDISSIKQNLKGPEDSKEKADDNLPSNEDILKDVQAEENKVDVPPASGQVSVLNLVARLQKEFQEYLNREAEGTQEVAEEIEKQEADTQQQRKENTKDRALMKSEMKRQSHTLKKVSAKVHESKLAKILKWVLFMFVGGWFFSNIWKPYIWPWIVDTWKTWGFENIAERVKEKFKEAFPTIYETLANTYHEVKDWIYKVLYWIEDITNSAFWKEVFPNSKGYHVHDYEAPKKAVVYKSDLPEGATGGTVTDPQWLPSYENFAPYDENDIQQYVDFWNIYRAIRNESAHKMNAEGKAAADIKSMLETGEISVDEEMTKAWRVQTEVQEAGMYSGDASAVYKYNNPTEGAPLYVIHEHAFQYFFNSQPTAIENGM